MRMHYLLALIALLHAPPAFDAVAQTQLRTRDVVTGLDTPWEILWGPDGHIWMTERGGKVSRVNPATGQTQLLVTIADVREQSESGLLGMALHPSFADTPWVYVVYNYTSGSGIAEKLVRYRYNGTALVEPVILLENIPGFTTHDGSRLLVTPDRKLLMTTGDSQDQPSAQRHTAITGKILRMNLDGSPAADNPWAGAPYPTNYLLTTGHRNPQGLTIGANGTIYSSEHGPDTDDEINIIRAARNYGWPNVHGMCNLPTETQFCSDSNVVEPIAVWTPTTAVAGVEYYDNAAIPEWRNSLLLTNLKGSDLRVLKLSADGASIVSETVLYDNVYGRLRDVAVAPDGRVFIATSNRDGRARPGFPKAEDDRIVEISAVNSAGSISAPSITPTPIEAGQQIQIEFTATGPFTANNTFTAQLSDATGDFASPTTLGTLSSTNGGIITTVLSCDVPAGTAYRVRITSSDPASTGPQSASPLTINAAARPVVVAPDGTTVCAGSSVRLAVSGGTRTVWTPSTGLSCVDCDDPIAMPTATTTYRVTQMNALGCETSDTITLFVRALPVPLITVEDRTLSASPGYQAYQWYRNDTAISGATSATYVATEAGSYSVSATDVGGCTGRSQSVQIASSGVDLRVGQRAGMRIVPQPVRDVLTIEIDGAGALRATVEIIDMNGSVVRTRQFEAVSGDVRAALDVRDLVPGAYVVRVSTDARTWQRAFVRR